MNVSISVDPLCSCILDGIMFTFMDRIANCSPIEKRCRRIVFVKENANGNHKERIKTHAPLQVTAEFECSFIQIFGFIAVSHFIFYAFL